MDNENKDNNGSFLLKIEGIRKKSHAFSIFLKSNDIIVAVNNELFTHGENALNDELREIQKIKGKIIITIFRDNIFYDVIVRGSLGCKFISTSQSENEEIQSNYSKKKIYDLEELKEYTVLRDLRNNFDCIEKTPSLAAGIFPPLWLAYEQKWWVLGLFSAFSILLFSVNTWLFMIGWLILSIYCYKAQTNLLFSFALLSGKAFTMQLATPSIELTHEMVRSLYPKSKFRYSKLENPISEGIEENEEVEKNITETNNALV